MPSATELSNAAKKAGVTKEMVKKAVTNPSTAAKVVAAVTGAKSIPAQVTKAVTNASKPYSNKKKSSESNYTQDAEGKWYDKTTGEPLGTGGTNAEWHERQGLASTSRESSGGGSGGSGGTSTDYGTYKNDLQRLTEAQRQAQVDQLKAARTKALQNLDVQEQNIKPLYQTARNQTSAASQQGARNFAEYLANRGLANSGASAQGEINRLSALQNNLGNINTQEANAYRDIANQRTAVENDYAANLANANNAITQQYYNNLLNYNEQQRQYVQALQNQALGQYANDYQAQINNLLAQGYSPNSMEVLQLQALRGNKANGLYNAGINNALTNVQLGNIDYNNAAALGMTVPQAQAYYQNYVAQQQAAAQAQQEALQREIAQQELTNQINLQKLANDTAQTQYNVNKPYNSTVYHVSNNNKGSDTNLTDATMSLAALTKEDGTPLYSNEQIANILNTIYG